MDYLSLMRHRLSGEEKNIPARLGNKKVIREFCELIGVNTAKILQIAPITQINFQDLPEQFVLKPSFASTSIGVLLLQRHGNLFVDIITKEEFLWEQLEANCLDVVKKFFKKENTSATFIIEELLFDHEGNTPPQDIRFYAFQGEIGMILKEDHLTDSRVHAMYFDGDFLPFPDLSQRYGVAPQASKLENIVEAIVPDNWEELLAVAKRISMAIPTPFARIDLYDTPNGVYLGEITLTPGTFYYKNRKIMLSAESFRLGRLWNEAKLRMKGTKDFSF